MLIRFLDNDGLSPDQINEIKDDVEYYIAENSDEHFVEPEDIYTALEEHLKESGVSSFFQPRHGCGSILRKRKKLCGNDLKRSLG